MTPPDTLTLTTPGEAITFTVPGEPTSKARARFTNYRSKSHAYTPEKTKAAESRVAFAFRQAGGVLEADKEVAFSVDVTFINGTRQRRDIDNMLKLVLDGLNGVAWVDDMQVVEVSARKRYVNDRADARTVVTVARAGAMDRLTKQCEHCGEPFATYPSLIDQTRFCSMECRSDYRRQAKERTCEKCGQQFLAHGPARETRFCSRECAAREGRIEIPCGICGTQFTQFQSWANQGRVYCSPECSRAHNAEMARKRRTKKFPGKCAICGAGTTRKEYRRCNPCKLAGKTSLPRELTANT